MDMSMNLKQSYFSSFISYNKWIKLHSVFVFFITLKHATIKDYTVSAHTLKKVGSL